MRLCIAGIGGAGGKVTEEFLQNVDFNSDFLSYFTNSRHVAPGRVEGIYLESAYKDAAGQTLFKDFREGGYPCFFIPQDEIQDGSDIQEIVQRKYGYSIKKQGFVRDAQFLKAIFEIFDTDEEIQRKLTAFRIANHKGRINPIFDGAWNVLRTYTVLNDPRGSCEGVLFIVSLGGGTGTGFINPIIDHIKSRGLKDFPVFVLGILTEPGDSERGGQKTKEGRRYLAAISAIYDLLTKFPGADGIILMDNEILTAMRGSDFSVLNRFIYSSMKPLIADRDYPDEATDGQATQTNFSSDLNYPPIFVPLYWSQPHRDNPEEELVLNALNKGRLFGCSPDKADKAIVYCRGFIDSEKIKDFLALHGKIKRENIWVPRKMGEVNDEILILLRNPYGNDKVAFRTPGTFEYKISKVIDSALRYIATNEDALFYRGKKKEGEEVPATLTEESTQAVGEYFFGHGYPNRETFGRTDGLVFELGNALRRLDAGMYPDDEVKPFDPHNGDPLFRKALRIFRHKGYLFRWNEIPGNDNTRLIDFLTQESRIDWVINAKFEKIDNGKTITASAENNSLSLKLDDRNNEVILEINNVRTHKFKAKRENGELNIYFVGKPERSEASSETDKVKDSEIEKRIEERLKIIEERLKITSP